jgi:hypothetical protein
VELVVRAFRRQTNNIPVFKPPASCLSTGMSGIGVWLVDIRIPLHLSVCHGV